MATNVPEQVVIPPPNSVWIEQDGQIKVLYQPIPALKEFHACDKPFVLTSGGRNSGKSTALRWDAHMRNLTIPGHKALLLRRTFPQLRGSHFDRCEMEGKILGMRKPFNRTTYFLEYDNGSKLQFGHCESDTAILDYLSQEWDWIGFDELTTFNFNQFIRISGSARTSASTGRKAYVRAATNPIGEGASWVRRYFIDKSVEEDENPEYKPSEWVNIPANMTDNPHADKEEYERKLLMLPSEALRRAYQHGEWLVEGQFFSEFKESKEGKPWHVLPEMPQYQSRSVLDVPWIEITRAVDWGYSEAEPGYCGWFAHLPDGTVLLFKEWVFNQTVPERVAQRIKEMSEGMKVRYTVGDPRMFNEERGESIAETMARNGVSMIPADNDRVNGWVRLHSWLVTTYFDGQFERPKLRFLRSGELGAGKSGCPYAIRTLPSLQVDPKDPSDTMEGDGVEDHAADAIRYWAMSRPSPTRQPKKTLRHLPKELQQAIYGHAPEDPLGSESVR